MGIWEWWGKCQGDLLYRVINWMLYGNVSIQGRCDLGEDWEWLGWVGTTECNWIWVGDGAVMGRGVCGMVIYGLGWGYLVGWGW